MGDISKGPCLKRDSSQPQSWAECNWVADAATKQVAVASGLILFVRTMVATALRRLVGPAVGPSAWDLHIPGLIYQFSHNACASLLSVSEAESPKSAPKCQALEPRSQAVQPNPGCGRDVARVLQIAYTVLP